MFGLLVKSLEDACEQVLVFRTAEDMQQQAVVNDLAKLLAQHNCSTMLVTTLFLAFFVIILSFSLRIILYLSHLWMI